MSNQGGDFISTAVPDLAKCQPLRSVVSHELVWANCNPDHNFFETVAGAAGMAAGGVKESRDSAESSSACGAGGGMGEARGTAF